VSVVLDVASGVLLLAGAVLALLGAIGVVRFREPLAAMHAATVPATLGVVLCGAGAALQLADGGSVARVVVIVVLQLVTAPIGAHMLSRALAGATPSESADRSPDGQTPPDDAH
jgi:multicomponent Na+:H+ antiporter subunit G